MNYYISHSAKGQTWKKHKYIAIKNGRYIYPAQKNGPGNNQGVSNQIIKPENDYDAAYLNDIQKAYEAQLGHPVQTREEYAELNKRLKYYDSFSDELNDDDYGLGYAYWDHINNPKKPDEINAASQEHMSSALRNKKESKKLLNKIGNKKVKDL